MPKRSSILVVGAGIIGSSIAWRLAQAGGSVQLVDAGRMGGEASGAGAGMLAPGGEFVRRSPWIDLALRSLKMYPDFLGELSQESGLPIDYRACGAVETAESSEEWPALRERAAAQRELGIECVAGEDAVQYPQDALVDPREVMAALRIACLRSGVSIFENCPETMVDDGDKTVVIAAGAWASGIEVRSGGRVLDLPKSYPVKGHLLGYWLPRWSLDPILRRGHTYLLQRSTGYTIAGSNEEKIGFDRTVDSEIAADLHLRAVSLFGYLGGRTPHESWIGFRPATETGELAIGRVEGSRVWLAYGHFRNGILMAPATAERVAGEILAG